jgi:hypothetical protein
MREQQLEQVIRTGAITYDPAFDVPSRLEQYRRTWGAEREILARAVALQTNHHR